MSRVRDLPETMTLANDDLFYVVDVSEGPNGGRKIKKENVQVTAEEHALSHRPGGSDDLPTAAPTMSLSPATTNAEGVGTSFSRNDHSHAIATALTANISTILPDDDAAAGASDTYARGDHKHAIATAAPSSIGTANSEGAASSFARSDHVHNHGSQTDGSHHAAATTSVNGFMSSTDKTKLDAMVFGFLAYTNSASQSTTQSNAAYTAVTLDTDQSSFPNSLLTKSSSTQFRTDFNGYVRISYKVLAQNTSSNDVSWRAAISKNGTAINGTETRSTGKTNADRYGSVGMSIVVPCATNDLFTLGFSNAEAATTNTISINAAHHAVMTVSAIYRTS